MDWSWVATERGPVHNLPVDMPHPFAGKQVLGCASEPIDLAASVALALAERDTGVSTVLLVCSQAGAGISTEVEQLAAVQRAVDDAQLSSGSLFIYTSSGKVEGQQRRMMQTTAANYTGFGPYQYCGELCRVGQALSKRFRVTGLFLAHSLWLSTS